ncbi:hypothetical protein C0992_011214 [Termitomyces sp. T32_za158]|nr:hypothetical protein C0992_011214 [Termitomyces sp. T32_za158]
MPLEGTKTCVPHQEPTQGNVNRIQAEESHAAQPTPRLLAQNLDVPSPNLINLPLSGVAFGVVTVFLQLKTPRETLRTKAFQIDWIGNMLIIASACSCMIALTWGGAEHSWSSYQVLIPLILGIVGLMFALLPTWFQAVQGASPITAGLHFMPWAVSISGFAIVGGLIVARIGKYKLVAWGVAIGGTVFQTALKKKLPASLLHQLPTNADIAYYVVPEISTLSGHLKHDVQLAFLQSFRVLWITVEIMVAIGSLTVSFMKDLPLRTTVDKDWGLEKKNDEETAENVVPTQVLTGPRN